MIYDDMRVRKQSVESVIVNHEIVCNSFDVNCSKSITIVNSLELVIKNYFAIVD